MAFIDGQQVEGLGAPRALIDPANGSVIEELRDGTPAQVDAAVRAAVLAQQVWAALTPGERAL